MIFDYGLIGSSAHRPAIGVAAGEWYRIVTGGFLHANVIHVAFNMLALYQLGMLLEPAFGRCASWSSTSRRCGRLLGVMLLTPTPSRSARRARCSG